MRPILTEVEHADESALQVTPDSAATRSRCSADPTFKRTHSNGDLLFAFREAANVPREAQGTGRLDPVCSVLSRDLRNWMLTSGVRPG